MDFTFLLPKPVSLAQRQTGGGSTELGVASKCTMAKAAEWLKSAGSSSRRVKVEDRTLGNSLKEEADGKIQQRYTVEGKRQGGSDDCLATIILSVPSSVRRSVGSREQAR